MTIKSNKTVGALLIEVLELAGVERIYGVPGDSLNAITDVIRTGKSIQWSHVRNEEAGAFAAGGEAALTGRLAVCAGSCGPGNLHLINGLYEAHRSRVPILAIAAQIPSAELGSGYFQETHPEFLFKECSVFCELVSSADQMPRVLEMAIQAATARRDVAVVVIPGDIASKPAEHPVRLHFPPPSPVIVPSPQELRMLASMLNEGGRITILGGAGCAGAHSELLALADKLQAPIVHSLRGKEHIEYDNPYDVGLTGLLGFSSGYYAMMHADTLLMLGTDFPYQSFYPEKARVIQIDIRGEQLGKRTKLDLGLIGDVQHTLSALLPLLDQQPDGDHLRRSISHYTAARKELDELAGGEQGKLSMHPQYLARILDQSAAEDAIFTCDVGTPTLWAARYIRMNGKRRLVGSFNHGSMANALSQAIGAQSAYPARQVIAMVGDGGLAMLLGELLTLIQMKLPVKVVVFQNDSLAFVELEMKAAGFLEFGTDLINPNFAEIAEASGLLGLRVADPADLALTLQQALAYEGPALVEVMVNRQELSVPPTITAGQMRGFSLYMLRAVLDGRGEAILDLATPNLIMEAVGVARSALTR